MFKQHRFLALIQDLKLNFTAYITQV